MANHTYTSYMSCITFEHLQCAISIYCQFLSRIPFTKRGGMPDGSVGRDRQSRTSRHVFRLPYTYANYSSTVEGGYKQSAAQTVPVFSTLAPCTITAIINLPAPFSLQSAGSRNSVESAILFSPHLGEQGGPYGGHIGILISSRENSVAYLSNPVLKAGNVGCHSAGMLAHNTPWNGQLWPWFKL